jgi:hypothetical protein
VKPKTRLEPNFYNTITEKYGKYDPTLLEVIENEYITMPFGLDKGDQRERPNLKDLDGQDLEVHIQGTMVNIQGMT